MKQYLIKQVPTRIEMLTEGPTQRETEKIALHFDYLKNLSEKGIVLMAGRTTQDDESTMGVVVFQAENDTEAQSIMNQDPAISSNVMKAELFPYRVAIWTNHQF